MVPLRVDGHAGDAARSPNQLLGQSLLCQVVYPHMVLGGYKQEGFQRVEQHPYDSAPVLAEGVLSLMLG